MIKKYKILTLASVFAATAAPCLQAQVSIDGTWYSESSTGSGVTNTSSGSNVTLQNSTGSGARVGAVAALSQTVVLNAVGDYIEVTGNYSGSVSNNVNYSIRVGFYNATGLTINQHYDADMDSLVGNFAGLATRWNTGAHTGIFNHPSNGDQLLALNQATPPNILGSSVTTASTGNRTITYRVERITGNNLQFTLNDGGSINFSRTQAVSSASTVTFNALAVGFFLLNDGTASFSDIAITSSGPVNEAPVVDAGNNQTITLPASASLDGSVSDDGLPGSGLTTTWSKVSGPGTVTFGSSGAVDTTASFSTSGTYVLRLSANDGALSASDDVTITVNPQPSGQSPYGGTAWAIPGRIEAENYDLGGSGVAFNDTTSGNSGGAYRSDNVDIETTSDVGGGQNVGWIASGEWLEYTVNVAQAGSYNITARVASQTAGGSLRIEMDGVNVSGTMSFSATGGWQNWINVTVSGVNLTAGQQVMRITMQSANFNLNYVDITAASGPANQAPVVSAGNPQTVPVTGSAFINATVTDDGLPNGTLTYQWTKQSGPGTVTFVSPTSEDTGVSFSAIGTYVLQLAVSDGALSSSDTVTFTVLNQSPGTPYDLSASSYLGGSSSNDEVVASVIQSNGVVVLAAQIGNANPGGVAPVLLNGSTSSTSGAIIRLSSNGRQVLSVTRLAGVVHDLSLDSNGNIYVAAESSGIIKLNSTAGQILFQYNPGGNVFRLNASANGTVVGLWDSYNVGDMTTAQRPGTIRVLSSTGSLLGSFAGLHRTSDVVLYQPSQSVITIGWRNANSPYNPVQISYMRSQSYNGTQNWKGYDWAANLLDAPGSTNNMADSRGHRISLGEDGKLYGLFEVAGGNHIFRYSPFDLLSPVPVVGGDMYHGFHNTRAEHKTFWARYEPATGDYILGQQLTARLSSGSGNAVRNRLGEIQADAAGRVYISAMTFSTLPYLNTHIPNYVTSGGFMLSMSADFTQRLFLGGLAQGGEFRTVAVRTLSGQTHPNIVFGGHAVNPAYLVSPIQSTPGIFQDGVFAVIDQTD